MQRGRLWRAAAIDGCQGQPRTLQWVARGFGIERAGLGALLWAPESAGLQDLAAEWLHFSTLREAIRAFRAQRDSTGGAPTVSPDVGS